MFNEDPPQLAPTRLASLPEAQQSSMLDESELIL